MIRKCDGGYEITFGVYTAEHNSETLRYAIPIEMIICLLSVKFFTEIAPKTKIGNILYLSFSIILIFMMID